MPTNALDPYRWYKMAVKYFSEPEKWEAWCKLSKSLSWTHIYEPNFHPYNEWELRPVTVPVKMVVGKTKPFPKPCTEAPKAGGLYWHVQFSLGISCVTWHGGYHVDFDRLNAGQIHLTESAAQQHADALREMTFEEVKP